MNVCHRKTHKKYEAKRKHWLDWAEEKYFRNEFSLETKKHLIEEIKMVLWVLVLYIPLPMFWALFDQQCDIHDMRMRWCCRVSAPGALTSTFCSMIEKILSMPMLTPTQGTFRPFGGGCGWSRPGLGEHGFVDDTRVVVQTPGEAQVKHHLHGSEESSATSFSLSSSKFFCAEATMTWISVVRTFSA
ncbi:hypothetical protein CRUP_011045 [Coryphaenoides rupestris]|nr:hypothetical protein CRUP_011045 [Coryphaenoides rupestris]